MILIIYRVLREGLDVPLVARVEEDGPVLLTPPEGVVDQVALLVHVRVREGEVVNLAKRLLITSNY